jgi:hypothetical protein
MSSSPSSPVLFYNSSFRNVRLTGVGFQSGGIICINGKPTQLLFDNCTLAFAKVSLLFFVIILFIVVIVVVTSSLSLRPPMAVGSTSTSPQAPMTRMSSPTHCFIR